MGSTLFAKTGHDVFSKRRVNTYHATAIFSRPQIGDTFLIFCRKWDLIFLANCLQIGDNNRVFLKKLENIINLLSAE